MAMVLPSDADTIRTMELDEVSIVSSIKEGEVPRQQAVSMTRVNGEQLANANVNELKGVSKFVPNFFMPDYGSRQTSAVYVRGIGSRIGTPAVGLYVDDVPYYDKSAFDFSFCDVELVDVMRGPQSTLYGRNTMGGLVKVYTKNPFRYTGTDVSIGFATKDSHRRVALTHHHRVSDAMAFSAGGFYDGGDGFFRNDFTGRKVDGAESGGGRLRAIWKMSDRWTLDACVNYEYSDEGAYPYFYTGAVSGAEQYPASVGGITSNLAGVYRRNLLNASVNAGYKGNGITLSSVTSFQGIHDRMFMDQDFLSVDIYSLELRQSIHTVSEELVLKNNDDKPWNWLLGANVFHQWQGIKAPVAFRKDGVSWLNAIINDKANANMPSVHNEKMSMDFLFRDNVLGDELLFDDDFKTPAFGVALFHQSTMNHLFGVDGLSATLGLRVDYEKQWMDYRAWYDFGHEYSLAGHLTMGEMSRDINMVQAKEYSVSNAIAGKINDDYVQFLPKMTVKYSFGMGNVYGTIARGYRSGGYNAQNISELMRSQMQTDMMKDVRDATIPVLQGLDQRTVPDAVKNQVIGILNTMAEEKTGSVATACSYRPEYAWNYEVGTHLDFADGRIILDASAFISDVSELQLSQMSQTGLGRIITNAGRSRSIGTEVFARIIPFDRLHVSATYGYTNATFREYHDYDADGKQVNCRGNHVPYVPQYTFSVDADYNLYKGKDCKLSIGATCSGVGKIYWDEQNQQSQSGYAQLAARVNADFARWHLQLWGNNLTNTRFNTFWFESMNRGFAQHGKPLQLGATLKFSL